MNTEMNETPCDPQDDTSYTGQIATLKRELSAKSAECQRLREALAELRTDYEWMQYHECGFNVKTCLSRMEEIDAALQEMQP